MSCICSTALAERPGEPGVLAVIGADPASGAHRGSGRLAAARSAAAAIAAKRTMVSVMFGVIKFFITRFLNHRLRSPQARLVVWTGRPALTTLWTATAGGVRLTDELSPAPVRPVMYGPLPLGPKDPGPEVFGYSADSSPDEPVGRARASALARTTSGSRGSVGRSSVQARSRRILGLSTRMRFIRPAAISVGWPRAVPAVFAGSAAHASAAR